MSIYDATEFLINKFVDRDLSATFEVLLAFIDDDDTEQAERLRSILHVRLGNMEDELDEMEDEFYDEDEEPELIIPQAATDHESEEELEYTARGILMCCREEFDDDGSLENIKHVVFREAFNNTHEEKISIAHMVYELYYNG